MNKVITGHQHIRDEPVKVLKIKDWLKYKNLKPYQIDILETMKFVNESDCIISISISKDRNMAHHIIPKKIKKTNKTT